MTKKIVALTLGILMVASVGFAKEVDPGTIEFFGWSNGGFSSSSVNGGDYKETRLNLDLGGLYYIIPNLGVGAEIGLTTYGGDADGTSLAIGPVVVYQFPIMDAMNVFGEGTLGYVSQDFGDGDADATMKGFYAGIAGGVSYFLNDNASVNAGLFYEYDGGDFDGYNVGLAFGLSIYLK